MGSETPLRLPIIDFSKAGDFVHGTCEWEALTNQVAKALQEFGCFEAFFDKIPMELRDSIFGVLEELFDLPLATKMNNISKKPFRGYVGQNPRSPLYESIGIDDADTIESVEIVTRSLWPQENHNFSETIHSYSKQLSELDQLIRRMILESLGVVKYLDEHINSTNYLLRVMKYKEPETNDAKCGLVPHTDQNMVTILYQNQTKGLEVQAKSGEWISHKPSPKSFVVMIGDCLHAWANGRFHAPCHRVMMSGNEARYSLGLFSIPKEGYLIEAPTELVDEEHPILFKPFYHSEYLSFCFSENGIKSSNRLKSFCGV